jgi:hypothetical protein
MSGEEDRAHCAAAAINVRPSVRSHHWVSGYPDLVKEWDRERNGDLRPNSVSARSAQRISWKCSGGVDHVWRAKPNNRTAGSGFPFCANRRVPMTNSLASCFPNVAAEWHPVRSGSTTAAAVVATCTCVAWWRCAANQEHEWRASVRDRVRRQTDCPFCSHRKVTTEASLARRKPWLSKQSDPERSGALSPEDVLPGSGRVVWWRCRFDPSRRWRASVTNRVCRGSGCARCARRRNRGQERRERAK